MVLNLPQSLAESAFKQYGETAETRTKALADLKARLLKLPESERPHRLDDEYLVAYLRGTKYRLDVAEKKLKAMTKFVNEHKQYTGAKAVEFREFYNQGFMRILKGHDKNGCAISTLLPARMTGIMDADLFLKWNFWVLEKVLMNPYMQVNGQVVIENFENFSLINMMTLKNIPSSVMQKCFKMQSECFPFRLRGIFIVNQPAYMRFLWAIVKPFMSKKLRQRVHFIGSNTAAFAKFIDLAVLPPEFGGTLDEPADAWIEEQIQAEAAAAENAQ